MESLKTVLATLPHSCGVYLFKDERGRLLYVGKAADLARRVRQYFGDGAVGAKTKLLISQIATIETVQTKSEFDALLLEAKLIHDFLPKYNVVARDDKSPLYLGLNFSEELPSVWQLRKTSLPGVASKESHWSIFGPFQSARVARMLLASLRSIVPYCTQKQRNGQPCFYTHLGLCHPCPSVIAKVPPGRQRRELVRQYRRNFLRLKAILSGEARKVTVELDKEMRFQADQNKFEEAALLKRQIQSLVELATERFDPSLYLSQATLVDDVRSQELLALKSVLRPYFTNLSDLNRIECVDVSNIGGRQPTGSLVVLTKGAVDTREYRRFRLRLKEIPSDVSWIAEVIARRLKHREWPLPDLVVVDGGKTQVQAAMSALQHAGQSVAVIGLAKRFEEMVVPVTRDNVIPAKAGIQSIPSFKIIRLSLTNPAIHVLQRIRDEAHRFARSYHELLRSKLWSSSGIIRTRGG